MPTKKTTRKPDAALAVIAKAKAGGGPRHLSPDAIAALRTLTEHNDLLQLNDGRARVSTRDALTMLRDHFGVPVSPASRETLNAMCQRDLGRKSWGTP